MPAYNGEKTIRDSIQSLLEQDYPNFELIICDDASTDRTAKICQEFAQKDPRIRFYRNQKNLGMYANWMKLLSLAEGKYFLWSANDDMRKPAFLSTMVNELEQHPAAGVAMSATELILEDHSHFGDVRYLAGADPNDMSHFRLMVRSAGLGRGRKKYAVFIYGMYRRDLLASAMRFFEDTLFSDRLFVTMMSLVTRFRYVDEILYIKMRHPKYQMRYPHEKADNLATTYLKRYRIVGTLMRMIWRCDLIPLHRKMYSPAAAIGLAAFLTRGIVREMKVKNQPVDD
jgi:glycosyltransferase involved in cell wall biosynthesis